MAATLLPNQRPGSNAHSGEGLGPVAAAAAAAFDGGLGGDGDGVAGADDGAHSQGVSRVRMADMVRAFRDFNPLKGDGAEALSPGSSALGADHDQHEVVAASAAEDSVDSPSADDDDEDHSVDELAAAVLQRSRAILQERSQLQGRIQAALHRLQQPAGTSSPAAASSQQAPTTTTPPGSALSSAEAAAFSLSPSLAGVPDLSQASSSWRQRLVSCHSFV